MWALAATALFGAGCRALDPSLAGFWSDSRRLLGTTDLKRALEIGTDLETRLADHLRDHGETPRLLLAQSQTQFVIGTLFEELAADSADESFALEQALREGGLAAFARGQRAAAAALALRNPRCFGGSPAVARGLLSLDQECLSRGGVPAATWLLANWMGHRWLELSDSNAKEPVPSSIGLSHYLPHLETAARLNGDYYHQMPRFLLALARTEVSASDCARTIERVWKGSSPLPLARVLRARTCAVATQDRELFRADLLAALAIDGVIPRRERLLAEVSRRQAVRFLGDEEALFRGSALEGRRP